MIKNVVFDCGHVIIDFNAVRIASYYMKSEEDAKLLADTVFSHDYFELFDLGKITDEQFIKEVKEKMPVRFHDAIEKITKEWVGRCPIVAGMDTLARDLKKDGKKVYLLSNFRPTLLDRLDQVPVLKEFDGLVVSGTIGVIKPDRRIYEYLFKTYHLNPEECFFIDDRDENIEMGRSFGMDGFVFAGENANSASCREYLVNKGILSK